MKRSFRVLREQARERKRRKVLAKEYERKLEERTGKRKLRGSLTENLEDVSEVLGDCADVVVRGFELKGSERKAAIIYIDELTNKQIHHDYVMRPLLTAEVERTTDLWEEVTVNVVQAGETKTVDDLSTVIDGILSGDTVLFIDGYAKALLIGSKGWEARSVSETRAEAVIRGPREGLNETLSFNWSLIRRRLKDPDLRIRNFTVGVRTKTLVSMLFIKDVAHPDIVREVESRIKEIHIDGVLETGYIEELIQDQIWTPFPLAQNTERPDAVVAHLLEGKIAILVDGTPHALIVPAVFSQFYSSSEDYYERYMVATFLRFIRLISFLIALFLPALYIAFVSYHPEMIPSNLAVAMAAGRASVPFNPVLEAMLMEVSVEILREASIRLPGPIGPTIGIVGGLVIGNAAVSAGLVSPAIVIVVGLTTISSYANPNYNSAISIRLLRFPFMILSAVFGLYGIMLGIMILMLHLVQLRSFGVPYMAPWSPLNLSDFRDTLIRVPWKWMRKRPAIFRTPELKRQERKET
ncbi:spore germination protein [Staphylospora marina]|uniref:spore germination protein n=1 Tax=Staphylospora marina TaxID=2490858 RepID=UPI000F5C2249|nr:spore germination protein [Staphylospora marina]